MTLKSIMFMLIMAFVLSAGAAIAASAADIDPRFGAGAYGQCVANAHKVISQRQATSELMLELRARRPYALQDITRQASNFIVPGITMPEERRAQMIAARVAECRRLVS